MGNGDELFEMDAAESYINDELGDMLQETEYKTDIIAIARRLGFKVVIADMNDADGYIIVNEEELIPDFQCSKVIGVNSEKDLKSKRFIIAKELSYYIKQKMTKPAGTKLKFASIDNFDDEHADDNDTNNEIDFIAGSLLMPKASFIEKRAELGTSTMDLNTIAVKLSDLYDVPVTTAKQRIQMLDKRA